jgi:hypothetical protein
MEVDRVWQSFRTFSHDDVKNRMGPERTLQEIQQLNAELTSQSLDLHYLSTYIQDQMTLVNQIRAELTEREQAVLQQRRQEEMERRRQNPSNMTELMQVLGNQNQVDILGRLQSWRDEDRVYLSSYERNASTDRKKQHIQGIFHVLGTVRKGVRDSYAVQFYKEGANPKGSFWCSCPDHKFNSTRKNIVCKHIAFLVTRVGRFFQPGFFETKHLSSDQHRRMLEIIESAAIFQDNTLCRSTPASAPSATATVNPMFLERKKPIGEEDVCPICYDNLTEASVTVSCPTCENNLHKECMEVWLERHDTCVYCRSNVWAQYS